jgi:hypothetical protein
MLLIEEIFLSPVPRRRDQYGNTYSPRHLTDREARLLRDIGLGRPTRRWIVWRDDAGVVTLGRPSPAGGYEMHRVYR